MESQLVSKQTAEIPLEVLGRKKETLPDAPAHESGAVRQLCLSHETALLFWRAVHEGRLPIPRTLSEGSLPPGCVTGIRELAHIDLLPLGVAHTTRGLIARYDLQSQMPHDEEGASKSSGQRMTPCGLAIAPGSFAPLHVLTAERGQRNKHPSIQAHLVMGELPPQSLCRVTESILVTSPELTLMHICSAHKDLPVLELLEELCGTYALQPAGLSCQFGRKPVTSVEHLTDYAAHVVGKRGCRRLEQLLEHASDGLASPRETELFLLLTLPRSKGGYELPRPQVNARIPVRGTPAERLSQAEYYEADLLWPDKRVIVEYDGFDEHESDSHAVATDKERRGVLAVLGYTVIVVTKRDLADESALARKVTQIACALDVTLQPATSRQAATHVALVRWLCNPGHDHLPFGCGYY